MSFITIMIVTLHSSKDICISAGIESATLTAQSVLQIRLASPQENSGFGFFSFELVILLVVMNFRHVSTGSFLVHIYLYKEAQIEYRYWRLHNKHLPWRGERSGEMRYRGQRSRALYSCASTVRRRFTLTPASHCTIQICNLLQSLEDNNN